MKIAHVINVLHRGGGAEKFLYDLLLAQSKDHDVRVVNILNPGNMDYIDGCRNSGIQVYDIKSKKYSLRGLFRLVRYIKNENPDIIHVHLFPALYYMAIAKMLSGVNVRLVYTEHNTTNRRRGIRIFKYIDSWIYSKYDKVFAISEQVALSIKNYLPQINPIIINNGVNITDIEQAKIIDLRKMLNLGNEIFFVTMVARFCDVKDYNTVIKSLCYLPTNIHFVCIGDGPTKGDSEQLVSELSLTSRVHFLGLRRDVYSLIKGSDIIVLSTHHEGFSISMLEAMACGKPFIASSVPGIKDLVADVAVLFEYKNEKQLAGIIQKVYLDRDYYSLLSSKSLLFVSKYDISVIADKYINEYM